MSTGKEELDVDEELVSDEQEEEVVMDLDSLTDADLEGLAVVRLRAVARQMNLGSMTRKEIRFAKKEELLSAIRAARRNG